jgi:IS30 family transposase
MTRRFQQLQPEERVMLQTLRAQGQSPRCIGRTLGRNAGSLSRELRRSRQASGYGWKTAQPASTARRQAARPTPKLDPDGRLWPLVAHMLGWYRSPQQIARTHQADVA